MSKGRRNLILKTEDLTPHTRRFHRSKRVTLNVQRLTTKALEQAANEPATANFELGDQLRGL